MSAAREAAQQYVEDVERQADLEERQLHNQLEEEAEQLRGVANDEIDELARKMNEEIEAIDGSVQARRQEIEKLQPMTLLTDAQHREVQEACGPIFEADMGAEALLEIIRRLDLDALAAQLREDVHASSMQRRKAGDQTPARGGSLPQVRRRAYLDDPRRLARPASGPPAHGAARWWQVCDQ